MEVLFDILYAAGAVLLLVLGLLGCVVPVIPGPALSYAALLLLLPSRFAPSLGVCVWFGIGCAAVLVLDTIVPALGAKKFRCSRWGVAGCIIGTVIGMFFGLLGLVLGPFVGAVLGEIIAGKSFLESVEDARFAPKALQAMREAYVEMPSQSLKDMILRFRARFSL
ncbi:MAG: DUF456 domain-containing protein [Kiritimatiellae bacterium]|nr:DUF456 domain-containing protein [Kiritimatiellia bacterium]